MRRALAIDERLFLSGVEERPTAASAPRGRPIQIVYIGSPTHARDLTLLRPVLASCPALRAESPGAILGGFRDEVQTLMSVLG